MQITRRLAFDAGHRIPDHHSQCRNLHGHRYVLEITLEGDISETPGASDCGMVLDFSEVKALMKTRLVDRWDHAFLVWAKDTAVLDFLNSLPDHKTVVLPSIPTAENLAKLAFEALSAAFTERFGQRLKLARLRLYETPDCWVDIGG
ncbi:MAG: 6-carboxytetrahydropterin synthase QueD [Zoogloeaceae bacterium]|jgi:6-pyruvoyltetrahydropterin/6-carboxytetrahydropterin synthase|nr:6-carboxytetrahydropterin synthase QueD [Zoogloeaceae bacterium]